MTSEKADLFLSKCIDALRSKPDDHEALLIIAHAGDPDLGIRSYDQTMCTRMEVNILGVMVRRLIGMMHICAPHAPVVMELKEVSDRLLHGSSRPDDATLN